MPVACTVTPGKQFNVGEKWTRAGFNSGFAPVVAVPDGSVVMSALSTAVQAAINAAAASAISAVSAKSADFTVSSVTDKGKLFDCTTGGSNMTATLPAAGTAGANFYFLLRKADTGAGQVLTSIATFPAAIRLAKQQQLALIYSDGTNWVVGWVMAFNFDGSGNLFTNSTFVAFGGSGAGVPALRVNGTQLQFRLGDNSLDAPMSASDGAFSGRVYNTAYFPLGNLTGAAAAIDASKANRFLATLTGNVTGLTLSNMAEGQPVVVCLLQDGTGGRTVAWTGIVWGAGGAAPTQTVTIAKRDFYSFEKIGSTIYGNQLANF